MGGARRSIAIAVIAAACARPGLALADGNDVAATEALFEAGRSAAEKGDYASACPRFRESERLDHAPGTLLNLADCEEHLHHLARAWEAWKEAVATLPADDARLPVAKQRELAIESRVPRLTMTRGPGAVGVGDALVVQRDDVEVHAASFDVPLPVDPGDHLITVTAPGRDSKMTPITLKEGETRTFLVDPGPPTPTPTPTPTATPTATPTPTPTVPFPWRTVGLVTGVVGVAGLGVGSVFGAMAMGKKSTVDSNCFGAKGCTQAGVDAARAGRSDAIASDVTFAVGGALLVAGGLLFFTHAPARTGLITSPIVLARGGGVALGADF